MQAVVTETGAGLCSIFELGLDKLHKPFEIHTIIHSLILVAYRLKSVCPESIATASRKARNF